MTRSLLLALALAAGGCAFVPFAVLPDGTAVVALPEEAGGELGGLGRMHLYATDLTGSGLERLTSRARSYAGLALSPDGSALYYVEVDEGLFRLDLSDRRLERVTERCGAGLEISPDGRYLLYETAEGSELADLERRLQARLASTDPERPEFRALGWTTRGRLLAVEHRSLDGALAGRLAFFEVRPTADSVELVRSETLVDAVFSGLERWDPAPFGDSGFFFTSAEESGFELRRWSARGVERGPSLPGRAVDDWLLMQSPDGRSAGVWREEKKGRRKTAHLAFVAADDSGRLRESLFEEDPGLCVWTPAGACVLLAKDGLRVLDRATGRTYDWLERIETLRLAPALATVLLAPSPDEVGEAFEAALADLDADEWPLRDRAQRLLHGPIGLACVDRMRALSRDPTRSVEVRTRLAQAVDSHAASIEVMDRTEPLRSPGPPRWRVLAAALPSDDAHLAARAYEALRRETGWDLPAEAGAWVMRLRKEG